jgi:hydrogenase maturation protein HypF
LAARLGLRGFVHNRDGGVRIEIEGVAEALDRFLQELETEPPPLARIDVLRWRGIEPSGDAAFRIDPSVAGDGLRPTLVSPDIATCEPCIVELFEPSGRRYRYPFVTCSDCGPRMTIALGAPYDRERTTMARFSMCRECRAEYDDPGNRRFHAQTIACPACGPRLVLLDREGEPVSAADAIACAARFLRDGRIAAIKGLGGYHLACDARNAAAVSELRRRKNRPAKPLAVMVPDLETLARLCEVSGAESEMLRSRDRPVVLLLRRDGAGIADAVAPGSRVLGAMLPYTPLHHLLLHELGSEILVMTSGNRSDEPIATDDGDAVVRLGGIADFFLAHDRPIRLRADDSVARIVAGAPLSIRRGRGQAPAAVRLTRPLSRPTLALGGQLKSTFALGWDAQALSSHHLGDLDELETWRDYRGAIEHYERLFAIRPQRIVHDLHPDYASTRYALERARSDGIETLGVAHHHAHLASCLADNGVDEPVIGVTFDGAGLGSDGTIWGGEFLVGDCAGFRRAGHLRPVRMPGGAQAIREPWRMALAALADAEADLEIVARRIPAATVKTVLRMIERGINSPLTSSAGRLFDAVAAIAGVRDRIQYEGQAAIELEALATRAPPSGRYATCLDEDQDAIVVDSRPIVLGVAADACRGITTAEIARRFHSTMAGAITAVCERLRDREGLEAVALSGGVFANATLLTEVVDGLRGGGFRIYRHRRWPPNDGGLALGQLAVAAAKDERNRAERLR